MIDATVLVLNRSYLPIHVTTVRRAFCLMAKGHVRAVDADCRTYDFAEWLELEPEDDGDAVETPRRRLRAPRIVLVLHFDRLPRREVKFSKRNVYLRDGFRCQLCGKQGTGAELNLDHVLPLCRGGKSSWENVVTSCVPCNTRKGNRTPAEAGMHLVREPARPRWQLFMGIASRSVQHPSWAPFMPALPAGALARSA